MDETPYRRRFGDRKEGRLLRTFPAYNKFTPFVMKKRVDSCNYFRDTIEVTELDRWIRAKRAEGYKGLGMLHVFVAAYIRTVAERPGLNRFVSGQRIYARNNIEILMTVKHALSDDSDESSIKVKFTPADTIFDVYRKMNETIEAIKADSGGNGTDKFAETIMKLPRPLLNLAVSLLKAGDYLGILPMSLLDISPFHGSMIITDMGSLGIPPIFHHIYDFGNLPLFISFGVKRRCYELTEEGRMVERKYVDFTVTSDERICDGFYLATSLKYIKHTMRNPQILEVPPEKVESDIF